MQRYLFSEAAIKTTLFYHHLAALNQLGSDLETRSSYASASALTTTARITGVPPAPQPGSTTRRPLLAASAAARGSPSTPTAPEDTQAEGATPGGAGRTRSAAPLHGQGLPPATATAGLRPALAPQHGGASGAAPAPLPAPHRPYLPPSRRSAGERGAPQRLPMRPPPRRGRLAGPPPRPGGEGRGPFPQRRRRRRASGSSGGRPPPGAQRRPAALRRLARVKRRRRQRRWSWGARAPGGR